MRFDIITIFPNIFNSYFNESIIGRAKKNGLIQIEAHDLRDWTDDNHKSVDDRPFGGGPGMVMMVEPIYKAVKKIKDDYFLSDPAAAGESKDNTLRQAQGIKQRVILFSAKGRQFMQADARRLAEYDQLILICGRYEGVDERVAEHIADEELSVGNFVLTGGEIPAMILVDAVSRLFPGVLGKEESLEEESFGEEGFVEYPQYTRPEDFEGWKVPEVLVSGNHKLIKEWKERMSKRKKPGE
jgi:tRNA (guanine37-N1)-methyltransferase